jgi:tRNA(Arg) A34 adenosine deaminase TadA
MCPVVLTVLSVSICSMLVRQKSSPNCTHSVVGHRGIGGVHEPMLKTIHIDTKADVSELSKKQNGYISIACGEAAKSNNNHFKHGCVAVRSGKVIGKGFNHNRTSICGISILTVHAELDVIYSLFLNRSKHMILTFAQSMSSGHSKSRPDRAKRRHRNERKKHKHNSIDLFVVKVNQKGELTESRPCSNCVYTLKQAGIRRVYYSTSDGTVCVEKVEHMSSDYLCMGHTRCMNEIELWNLNHQSDLGSAGIKLK